MYLEFLPKNMPTWFPEPDEGKPKVEWSHELSVEAVTTKDQC